MQIGYIQLFVAISLALILVPKPAPQKVKRDPNIKP